MKNTSGWLSKKLNLYCIYRDIFNASIAISLKRYLFYDCFCDECFELYLIPMDELFEDNFACNCLYFIADNWKIPKRQTVCWII